MPRINKKKRLERLKRSLEAACRETAAFRKETPVFGDGRAASPIMVVGEAPGRDETRERRPFVGKAGRFLISVLKDALRMHREELYITNVVKVWPTVKTKRLKTRKPTREEEAFFLPYLNGEISIVDPEIILAVGKTAFCAIVPGESFKPGVFVRDAQGRLVMPVYHPAYILRKQKSLKENTGELKAALKRIKRAISRKG